jgi:hypothetical protein
MSKYRQIHLCNYIVKLALIQRKMSRKFTNRKNTFFSGHCGKCMAIINRFDSHPDFSSYTWLLIADDDTIIK